MVVEEGGTTTLEKRSLSSPISKVIEKIKLKSKSKSKSKSKFQGKGKDKDKDK